MVAGRIDNGASLKIAATNGKVVDAVTHAVVWMNDNGLGYKLRLARFPSELVVPRARTRRNTYFSRSLLPSENFSLQNCVILGHALQTGLVRHPSEKHVLQRCENLRNSLGLNYKSAALSGGTAGCKIRNHMYTSGTDSLLFGRRRDAQIRHCGQTRVHSTPHTIVGL